MPSYFLPFFPPLSFVSTSNQKAKKQNAMQPICSSDHQPHTSRENNPTADRPNMATADAQARAIDTMPAVYASSNKRSASAPRMNTMFNNSIEMIRW
jgi:hypothetical protein